MILPGNELWRISSFFGLILLALIVGKVAKFFLLKTAERISSEEKYVYHSLLLALAGSATFVLFSISIAGGLQFLKLQYTVKSILTTSSQILLVLSLGYMTYKLVDVPGAWIDKLLGKSNSKIAEALSPIIRKSLRVTLIVLVIIQIFQIVSDKPMTSVLAGLGIGGLAFALAAQDTIKNFFGSIVILSDQPFQIGERVVIDGHDGPIEKIGFRSTKLRTLDGHLVTIPNGELANKTVLNIGKRPYIRRLSSITITYDTPLEKVEKAVNIIKEILDNHEGMKDEFPPRVYFNNFNDASLNILMIYWYHPPDYWAFIDFSQRVNLAIMKCFEAEGIDFAFPTQTLHVAGDPKRPLNVGVSKVDT